MLVSFPAPLPQRWLLPAKDESGTFRRISWWEIYRVWPSPGTAVLLGELMYKRVSLNVSVCAAM